MAGHGRSAEGISPFTCKGIPEKLESAWDETRFIDGYPGKFICLARRKANKWFIAGINAGKERTVTIPLNFITSGKYSIEIYEDNPNEK